MNTSQIYNQLDSLVRAEYSRQIGFNKRYGLTQQLNKLATQYPAIYAAVITTRQAKSVQTTSVTLRQARYEKQWTAVQNKVRAGEISELELYKFCSRLN